MESDDVYLYKARESLAGAESEFVKGRFNKSANRCCYAVFQAAIYALMNAGIRPPTGTGQWGHDFVQAQFVGLVINRRKIFPASLRNTLEQNYRLRELADYRLDYVSDVQAARAVRRASEFVTAIATRGEHER